MKVVFSQFGFRKDFDYETRFYLINKINGYYISTVDLGRDHSFGIGKPLYYETMIFKNGYWEDLYCERYSTEEEAIKGHQKAIEYIKIKSDLIDKVGSES